MNTLTLKIILKRAIGNSVIASSLFITLIVWFFTLSNYSFIKNDPFLFLSKMFVLPGTIAMCWTFILATRAKLLENIFNGLDKVYYAHRTIGTLSFILIFLHPLFQFFRYIPNWSEAFGLFIPTTIGAIEFGLFAFVLFVVLISLTLWIKIPYHIWKRTHEFFIVVLLLTFFHIFFINKHINSSMLLSIWIYGFIFLGISSYIYIRFLYRFIGPVYEYKVVEINNTRKTWNIYLVPVFKNLEYKPAQFLYISFDNKELGKEAHPFSISSYPGQDYLRLSIKELGDYTSKMNYLNFGDKAKIWGPYGKFYEKYLYESQKDAVFIAGGIGITPFLSLLGFESRNPSNRKTYVFYCVKDLKNADFNNELLEYSKMNSNIKYILYCSDELGFLDITKLKKELGSLDKKNFFICGPTPMMKSLSSQLSEFGVKNYNIVLEDFNFI